MVYVFIVIGWKFMYRDGFLWDDIDGYFVLGDYGVFDEFCFGFGGY